MRYHCSNLVCKHLELVCLNFKDAAERYHVMNSFRAYAVDYGKSNLFVDATHNPTLSDG